ncbi:MAG: ABC transporter ATP-binding protein [Clostridia bacterium]
MKTILKYARPYLKRILLGLSIKTVSTLMDLLIPWMLAKIIDDVIPTGNINMIFLWGAGMILCSILCLAGNVTANRMASSVARDTTGTLRRDLFIKISYLSNTDVDKFTVPTLISRMTTDTYAVHQVVGMIQRLGVRAPLLLIGGICVTLFLDPVLTLAMIAILPIAAVIMVVITKLGVRLYKNIQHSNDDMVRVVRENATGARVIKALSKSEYEKTRFEKVNSELTGKEKKTAAIMAVVNPSMSFLMNAGFVVVILMGAYRVNAGTSEIGTVIAFMSYFNIILNALMSITRMFTITSKATASAERINEVLETASERNIPKDGYTSGKPDPDAPHIEFKNVSFSYNNSKFLIDNISFSIPRHSTVGIIAATGAGKSTIAHLMMRFYDIKSGEILIGGQNIYDMPLIDLRSRFGVVFQNDTLFKNTIIENIRLGRDIDMVQIQNAVSHAQADTFVEEAGGYDAAVAIKGMNLSGGQKQRLLISRALSGNPEILILDDASSALDYKTDARLRACLNSSYKESTKIIITQRISSIMNADCILVLDAGRILGRGTHEELMKTCAIYREISASQLGGVSNASA